METYGSCSSCVSFNQLLLFSQGKYAKSLGFSHKSHRVGSAVSRGSNGSNGVVYTRDEQHPFISKCIADDRRFALELSPKLLYSRGDIVELLISSDTAQYIEYQLVNSLYYYDHAECKVEQVPGSRQDIFANSKLSLIEKRILMKFLTFALNYESSPDVYQAYADKPFSEFTVSQGIPLKLCTVITSALCLETSGRNLSTLQGLERLQRHLQSAGRYGKGAFLSGRYGTSSEISQAFCRYSAIHGTCFRLNYGVTSVDEDDSGVVVHGEDGGLFRASKLIMNPRFSHLVGLQGTSGEKIRVLRGIVISDKPLFGDGEHAMLSIPGNGQRSPALVVQASQETRNCPEGYFVLYLLSQSTVAEDAGAKETGLRETSLEWAVDLLVEAYIKSHTDRQVSLFESYYTHDVPIDNSVRWKSDRIAVTEYPTGEIDAERSVEAARKIFKPMCPDKEFYPPRETREP